MFFVMALAGMVCTALSVSGQAITDLKTGYWLGSTPAAQEKVKFLGVIAASAAVGLTIVLLARAFQFGEAAPGDVRAVLPSPQASIMKALVEGFMSHQPVAYILFGAGAADRRHHGDAGRAGADLRAGHVSAAGTEHPGAGGRLPGALSRQALRETGGPRGRTVRERGVIIASGLMAGGALGGVFGAALPPVSAVIARIGFTRRSTATRWFRNWSRRCFFVGLCVYFWFEIGAPQGGNRVMSARFQELVGNAILGIDTLWGGDVMCASGEGPLHRRFVVLR